MFKLQLVVGLLFGIKINIIRAEQQVIAAAKIGNATSDITILDSSLGDQNDNTNKRKNNNSPDEDNPEEGNHIQGDLLVPTDELGRLSIKTSVSAWPAGLVPYKLDRYFTKKEIKTLRSVFKQFAAKTCIRFRKRTIEQDYIEIWKPTEGCASYVGRKGGKQTLDLGPNCFRRPGIIIHELMHVLGFLHEQNSYDRDDYVKIIFENVIPGKEKNFLKVSFEESTNLGVPYDYGSIMHYRANAFSSNRQPTIVALKEIPNGVKLGQRDGFSRYDLERINRRYQCSESEFYRKIRTVLSSVLHGHSN